jgi:ribonuclease D
MRVRRSTPTAAPARAGLALALLAVAASAQQQRPTSLSAAWLAEHLRHAPRGRLAAVYEQTVGDERNSAESRILAAARLLEIARVTGDEAEVADRLRTLRDLTSWEEGPGIAPIGIDRDALRAALALDPGPEREARLEAARDRIDEQLREARIAARVIVAPVARRIADDRDAEREILERDLGIARAAGQTDRVRELEIRLRESRGGDRSGSVDRLRAWRVRLVRLLNEARFDQAEVLRERLPGEELPSSGEPRQRLADALRDPALGPQERAVLEEFAARLADWDRRGGPESGRALRLLPY